MATGDRRCHGSPTSGGDRTLLLFAGRDGVLADGLVPGRQQRPYEPRHPSGTDNSEGSDPTRQV